MNACSHSRQRVIYKNQLYDVPIAKVIWPISLLHARQLQKNRPLVREKCWFLHLFGTQIEGRGLLDTSRILREKRPEHVSWSDCQSLYSYFFARLFLQESVVL